MAIFFGRNKWVERGNDLVDSITTDANGNVLTIGII